MSTPHSLVQPPGVTVATISTSRGRRAALRVAAHASLGTVVLVPGFTGSKEDFLTLLPELAALGYDALAYDQYGQYESDNSDVERDYTLDLLAADLIEIARAETAPVHVVGHSFGGLVVARAVAIEPSAFSDVVILASGLQRLSGPLARALEMLLEVPAGTTTADVWAIRRQIEGPLDPTLPVDVAAFVEAKFVASPLAALQGKARILVTADDLSPELASTGVRTAVMTGADDDHWSHATQRAVAVTLGTELVLLPKCGHSPAVDHPALVAKQFDGFWKQSHS